jgi:hypothetical protein
MQVNSILVCIVAIYDLFSIENPLFPTTAPTVPHNKRNCPIIYSTICNYTLSSNSYFPVHHKSDLFSCIFSFILNRSVFRQASCNVNCIIRLINTLIFPQLKINAEIVNAGNQASAIQPYMLITIKRGRNICL